MRQAALTISAGLESGEAISRYEKRDSRTSPAPAADLNVPVAICVRTTYNETIQRKRQLLEGAEHLFEGGAKKSAKSDEPEVSELPGRVDAFNMLIEIYFWHYQYHSNMFVATAISWICRRIGMQPPGGSSTFVARVFSRLDARTGVIVCLLPASSS